MNELMLAQSALTIFTSFAISIAQSVGDAVQDKAGEDLYGWIKSKFKKAGKDDTLQKLEQKPESETALGEAKYALAGILEDDKSAMKELQTLLEALPKGEQSQTATTFGDHSHVTQIQGNNNTVR